MAARNPEDRALSAQIASAERWGRVSDRSVATQPARDGLRAKWAAEVDPDNTLDPAERERRVDHLQRAHMLRMSLAAKRARRKRAGRTVDLPDGDVA
jgi:hypothetical protein